MKKFAGFVLGLIVGTGIGFGQDLKASLPFLPPLVETKDKGILVDLVKAIGKEYTGGKIEIEVAPFNRALKTVADGDADFEMPLIVPKKAHSPYRYSSAKIFDVVFVLFANKNNADISVANLDQYKIETDPGNLELLGVKATVNPDIESGLRKVSAGRSDGYLYAMVEGDTALKKLGLTNIKRIYFDTFDVKIVLPAGPKGDKADKILSDAIAKLKKDGTYDKIMAPLLNQKFKNKD